MTRSCFARAVRDLVSYYKGMPRMTLPTAAQKHFKIDLWPEPNREDKVFGSKAAGEPPLMLAISAYEAIRDAIASVQRPVVNAIRRVFRKSQSCCRCLGNLS